MHRTPLHPGNSARLVDIFAAANRVQSYSPWRRFSRGDERDIHNVPTSDSSIQVGNEMYFEADDADFAGGSGASSKKPVSSRIKSD